MRPLREVLRDHAPRILAAEGVVGVYEGADASGVGCVKILVARRTAEIEAALPREIEGYPVVLVESGPLGPRSGA
jgi:hypothetical protein